MARKNRARRRDPAWEVLRRGLPATRSPETVRRADGGGVSWLSAPARWIEGPRSCSPFMLDPHGSREGRWLLAEDVEEHRMREELLLGLVIGGDEASGRRSASGAGSSARRKEESKGAMRWLWLGGSMDW